MKKLLDINTLLFNFARDLEGPDYNLLDRERTEVGL
jgi:hypothetical protein